MTKINSMLSPMAEERIAEVAADEVSAKALSSLLESEHFPALLDGIKKLYEISAEARKTFSALNKKADSIDSEVFRSLCRREKLGMLTRSKMSESENDGLTAMSELVRSHRKAAEDLERRTRDQKEKIKTEFSSLADDLNCMS